MQILKNYENICHIGKKIIKHKKIINTIPKSQLDIEFRNQEIRIEEFSDAIKKADKEWNPNTLNKYWTGLS